MKALFINGEQYQIARYIKSICINSKEIQNLVVVCDSVGSLRVINLKDKREYIRKGYGVVGYFDYLPTITNLNLMSIIEEVFNYDWYRFKKRY